MASNRGSLTTNIRECPVCLDDMTKKNPKLLNCKHSYCTPCLSELAEATQRSGLKIQCPKCRHNTVLRSGKLSDLPVNFLLGELKAVIDETIRYPYCFYCNKLDKETKADSHCTNCRRYLCKDCLDKHKKNPQFTEHEIIPLLDEETEGFEVCCKHNEIALYVCRACSPVQLLCDVCMTLEDPCHDPEKFIDYTAALSELQSELNLELSKNRNFDKKISKLNSKKQMLIKHVQENAAAFIKSIEVSRDEIISQIEESFETASFKLGVSAVKETELRVKELLEKDNKKITELSAAATDITKLCDQAEKALSFDFDRMLQGGHEEQMIITGTGATYMKLKLFDLSTFRSDSEDGTPEVREENKPLSISTRLYKNKVQYSKDDGDREKSVKMLKKKIPISADPKGMETEFTIGSSVQITMKKYGVIRWFGFYGDDDRPLVGIEMEEESDALTDGTYMGHKLFDCQPRKSAFTLLSRCSPDRRPKKAHPHDI